MLNVSSAAQALSLRSCNPVAPKYQPLSNETVYDAVNSCAAGISACLTLSQEIATEPLCSKVTSPPSCVRNRAGGTPSIVARSTYTPFVTLTEPKMPKGRDWLSKKAETCAP